MKPFEVDPEKCTHDGLCAEECPARIIRLDAKEEIPIPADDFDFYSEIVDRLSRSERDHLPVEMEDALLNLALQFTPAVHKMASLSMELESRLMEARKRFMEKISREVEMFQNPGGTYRLC